MVASGQLTPNPPQIKHEIMKKTKKEKSAAFLIKKTTWQIMEGQPIENCSVAIALIDKYQHNMGMQVDEFVNFHLFDQLYSMQPFQPIHSFVSQ